MQETKLETSTMIVALELGLPRQATQLKEEASKIEKENKAEKGTVKASIHYFRHKGINPKTGKMEELDGLQMLKDFQQGYRIAVNNLARYPYSGGFYLAPAGVVDDLLKVEAKFTAGKTDAWLQWAGEVYPDLAAAAPARMGALYKEDDFPSMADCMKRFRCVLTILPLAEKEQVARIALISQSSQKLLMEHADATSKAAVDELHKQIWTDFMGPLQHVVKVFEKDKPKIYETLLGNLLQIVNVIPSYKELTGDTALVAAAEEVKAAFIKITTEDLRTSEEARKNALTTAKELVNKFEPFSRKFS